MIKMGKKYGRANVDGRASVEVSELKEIRSHLEKIYIQSLVKLFH